MTMRRLFALMALLGCASLVQAAASDVGMIGDATVASLASRLEAAAPGTLHLVQGPEAVTKSKPKVVLYVVNSAEGPQAAHREGASALARAGLTHVVLVFTETSKMNDPELLELEIRENVEILNKAGIGGVPAVAVDLESFRADPKLKVIKGVKALSEYLRTQVE